MTVLSLSGGRIVGGATALGGLDLRETFKEHSGRTERKLQSVREHQQIQRDRSGRRKDEAGQRAHEIVSTGAGNYRDHVAQSQSARDQKQLQGEIEDGAELSAEIEVSRRGCQLAAT